MRTYRTIQTSITATTTDGKLQYKFDDLPDLKNKRIIGIKYNCGSVSNDRNNNKNQFLFKYFAANKCFLTLVNYNKEQVINNLPLYYIRDYSYGVEFTDFEMFPRNIDFSNSFVTIPNQTLKTACFRPQSTENTFNFTIYYVDENKSTIEYIFKKLVDFKNRICKIESFIIPTTPTDYANQKNIFYFPDIQTLRNKKIKDIKVSMDNQVQQNCYSSNGNQLCGEQIMENSFVTLVDNNGNILVNDLPLLNIAMLSDTPLRNCFFKDEFIFNMEINFPKSFVRINTAALLSDQYNQDFQFVVNYF
jgi:hypothetical protein